MAKLFKRPTRKRLNTADTTGRVRIQVLRMDGRKVAIGNLTRTLVVDNATVTKIVAVIEAALFGAA